ncbi:MarC family protein, partial [Escherichia coli]|uniref:MarC family protein n=1 Tax=Escherichia coli TaxID=562 RepID=UPI0035B50B5E
LCCSVTVFGRVLLQAVINVITRIIGLLLMALGIEFIVTGIKGIFPGLLNLFLSNETELPCSV